MPVMLMGDNVTPVCICDGNRICLLLTDISSPVCFVTGEDAVRALYMALYAVFRSVGVGYAVLIADIGIQGKWKRSG